MYITTSCPFNNFNINLKFRLMNKFNQSTV